MPVGDTGWISGKYTYLTMDEGTPNSGSMDFNSTAIPSNIVDGLTSTYYETTHTSQAITTFGYEFKPPEPEKTVITKWQVGINGFTLGNPAHYGDNVIPVPDTGPRSGSIFIGLAPKDFIPNKNERLGYIDSSEIVDNPPIYYDEKVFNFDQTSSPFQFDVVVSSEPGKFELPVSPRTKDWQIRVKIGNWERNLNRISRVKLKIYYEVFDEFPKPFTLKTDKQVIKSGKVHIK